MGNARGACFDWTKSRPESHAVLGKRHRRILSDACVDWRTLHALVSIFSVLPLLPIAWAHLEIAAAVGLEHRRIWPCRKQHQRGPRRAAQCGGGTNLSKISRTALPSASLQLHSGAGS